MNRALKGLFALTLMTSLVAYSGGDCCDCNNCDCCYDCDNCCLGTCDGYPYIQMRSQGRDSAREIIGWQQFVHKYCPEENYGAFSLAVEYEKTFREDRIAHNYFGNDLVNCCELYVQGAAVEDRNEKAWYADYFGLAPDFDSRVKFCPEIQNVVIDLDFYWGLDCWKEGVYVRLNAPIVWSKWELCPCENVKDKGESGFAAGYMAEDVIERAKLADSFLQVMRGGHTFGDMKTAMNYGLINNCACSKTRLGEIDLSLGWDFVRDEDYHFGLFAYVAAPAGNRPCAKYLFEPIVGNGKHWELGGGLSGHWIFWRNDECDTRYMGLWMEATVAHLFKTCQTRSFDFCKVPNSRYMLLEEMTKADGLLTGAADAYTPAEYQYAKALIPAINWSTFNVDVRIPVMADIAVKLGWVRDAWNFDLGYNLYARSGEKFCNCCCNDTKLYAIKGDAGLYGDWFNAAPGAGGDATTVAISKTQSKATIHGPNKDAEGTVIFDNPQNAFYTDGANHRIIVTVGDANQLVNQIQTSIQPVLVNKNMLNMGKSPSMITHKLFANINYAWTDRECDDWTPFLGIGGKVEFAQTNWNDCCCDCDCNCGCDCNDNCNCGCNSGTTTCGCDDNCNCCNDCNCSKHAGVSTWGVWVKGGVAFD